MGSSCDFLPIRPLERRRSEMHVSTSYPTSGQPGIQAAGSEWRRQLEKEEEEGVKQSA